VDRGFTNIYRLGIAFYGKECAVKAA
jgi:hypothetical protein